MALDLLEQILPHIKDSIYPLRTTLSDWKMKEGDHPNAASPSLNDRSWTSIRLPFQWGKYDKTFWFRKTIKVTAEFSGKPLALLFDFPDALLFINGKPYHGIDQHHNEIWITEKSKLNEQFSIAVQAYSGRKHEHDIFAQAELAVLDPTARRLASGLCILQELDKFMEHSSQESKDIRELIRHTLIYLKYFRPGSEEYPNAIRRAYNFLLNTLETDFKTSLPGLIRLIGHSHINMRWSWTLNETVRKCGHTFSSMLRLMEEFPEFKFSQSQAILYEFTKTQYPDLYKQIKQRVAEGRWEPMGSLWLETDCHIPNGESLVRQILFGKKYFKQEFGIDSDTLWLPNPTGFSWALPQILKKSGIKYFYSSKFTSNDTTTFPFTSFWWQGVDGSKILTHISPVGIEGLVTPKSLLKSGEPAQQQPSTSPILQTFGYGDSGGGPTKEHLELAIVLKTIIGLPSSQLSTVQEFFREMEAQSENLPTWNNELFLETHSSTSTTQAQIKKENHLSEILLYNSELLSTIALLFGKRSSVRRYPMHELEQAWKKLLLNHSHDMSPDPAPADVSKNSEQEYQTIRNIGSTIINNCVQGISQPSKKSKIEFHFTIFNPLGWARNEYVEISVKSTEKHIAVEDSDGNLLMHQVVERTKQGQRILCYVENIAAFGFKNIVVKVLRTHAEPDEQWKISTHGLESPLFKVRLDNKGTFSSIYSKNLRRELVQKGKRSNVFQAFRESSKQDEAWNIDVDFEKHKTELWKFKQMKFLERGPLRATIRLEFRTDNGSILSQDVRFFHKHPRIDFLTNVRWQERQILLKVAFPLNLKGSNPTHEIQFGAIDRSTKTASHWEKAKFEVPAQQWVDLSDAKCGVGVLNDCKYAYDVRESTLRLTLLRSLHYPHPVEPLHKDEGIDQGNHSFCYSLYPHSGDWIKGETVQRAGELNNPVLVFSNIRVDGIPSLMKSSKPNIIFDAIKKAEESDAIIIRMHEAYGMTTDTALRFGFDAKNATECDLLENDLKQHQVVKSKLLLKFKPFEIKTVKLSSKSFKKKK